MDDRGRSMTRRSSTQNGDPVLKRRRRSVNDTTTTQKTRSLSTSVSRATITTQRTSSPSTSAIVRVTATTHRARSPSTSAVTRANITTQRTSSPSTSAIVRGVSLTSTTAYIKLDADSSSSYGTLLIAPSIMLVAVLVMLAALLLHLYQRRGTKRETAKDTLEKGVYLDSTTNISPDHKTTEDPHVEGMIGNRYVTPPQSTDIASKDGHYTYIENPIDEKDGPYYYKLNQNDTLENKSQEYDHLRRENNPSPRDRTTSSGYDSLQVNNKAEYDHLKRHDVNADTQAKHIRNETGSDYSSLQVPNSGKDGAHVDYSLVQADYAPKDSTSQDYTLVQAENALNDSMKGDYSSVRASPLNGKSTIFKESSTGKSESNNGNYEVPDLITPNSPLK